MNGTEEEFVPEEEAEEGPAALKKLRERLQKAVAEKQEYLEGWQRARADFANYKKEEASIHGEREVRTKADLVASLLPALDTFEMALQHGSDQTLELVHKQLLDALGKLGVERFGNKGEPFDPRRHEALSQVETEDEAADHTIESVRRSGYVIGDVVIRPAQVVIFTHQ